MSSSYSRSRTYNELPLDYSTRPVSGPFYGCGAITKSNYRISICTDSTEREPSHPQWTAEPLAERITSLTVNLKLSRWVAPVNASFWPSLTGESDTSEENSNATASCRKLYKFDMCNNSTMIITENIEYQYILLLVEIFPQCIFRSWVLLAACTGH